MDNETGSSLFLWQIWRICWFKSWCIIVWTWCSSGGYRKIHNLEFSHHLHPRAMLSSTHPLTRSMARSLSDARFFLFPLPYCNYYSLIQMYPRAHDFKTIVNIQEELSAHRYFCQMYLSLWHFWEVHILLKRLSLMFTPHAIVSAHFPFLLSGCSHLLNAAHIWGWTGETPDLNWPACATS